MQGAHYDNMFKCLKYCAAETATVNAQKLGGRVPQIMLGRARARPGPAL